MRTPWTEAEVRLVRVYARSVKNGETSSYRAAMDLTMYWLRYHDHTWEGIRAKLNRERKGLK